MEAGGAAADDRRSPRASSVPTEDGAADLREQPAGTGEVEPSPRLPLLPLPQRRESPLRLPQRREPRLGVASGAVPSPRPARQALPEQDLGLLQCDLAEARVAVAAGAQQLRFQSDGVELKEMDDLTLQVQGLRCDLDFRASQHQAELSSLQAQLEQSRARAGAVEDAVAKLQTDLAILRQRQEMHASTMLEEHLSQVDTVQLLLRQQGQRDSEAAALLDRLGALEQLASATSPAGGAARATANGQGNGSPFQELKDSSGPAAPECTSPRSRSETNQDGSQDTSSRLARLVGQMDAGLRVEFTSRVRKLVAEIQSELVAKLSAQTVAAERHTQSVEASLKADIQRLAGDLRPRVDALEADLQRIVGDFHSRVDALQVQLSDSRCQAALCSGAASPSRPPSPIAQRHGVGLAMPVKPRVSPPTSCRGCRTAASPPLGSPLVPTPRTMSPLSRTRALSDSRRMQTEAAVIVRAPCETPVSTRDVANSPPARSMEAIHSPAVPSKVWPSGSMPLAASPNLPQSLPAGAVARLQSPEAAGSTTVHAQPAAQQQLQQQPPQQQRFVPVTVGTTLWDMPQAQTLTVGDAPLSARSRPPSSTPRHHPCASGSRSPAAGGASSRQECSPVRRRP